MTINERIFMFDLNKSNVTQHVGFYCNYTRCVVVLRESSCWAADDSPSSLGSWKRAVLCHFTSP